MPPDREPIGSPVTPLRGAARGPSAGLALLGVVAVLAMAIGVAVVSRPGPSAPPSPAAARPSPPGAAAVSPSAPGAPSPSGIAAATLGPASPPGASSPPGAASAVVVLRGVADPVTALADLTGCRATVRSTGSPLVPPVRGAAVDAAAAAAGRDAGWLFVPPGPQASTKAWLGDDVVALALAVGQPVVAISPSGVVWLGGPAGATRWAPIATPAGRTAWVMANDEVAGTGPCDPWSPPGEVDGLRAVTCAGLDLPACLNLLPIARGVPGLIRLGGDLVVTVPSCADSHRCFAPPLTLIGVPAGWSGSPGEIRAVTVDQTTNALAATPPDMLPSEALDALGRPSLPLPVGGESARGNDCRSTIAGPLRGAPWDPRVAWVGDTAVRWPTGTTVRFLPFAGLSAPGEPNPMEAWLDETVIVTGSLDRSGTGFDACRVSLAPVGTARPSPSR